MSKNSIQIDTACRFDVQDLIDAQRIHGRSKIPEAKLTQFSKHHDEASSVLRDYKSRIKSRSCAKFISLITQSLKVLSNDPVPTYYTYTDVHILDWYIGDSHQPFNDLKTKCIVGIKHLLLDLLHFETESITGFVLTNTDSISRDHISDRIDSIKLANDQCDVIYKALGVEEHFRHLDVSHYASAGEYASESTRISGLIHFTAFPQTSFHDEYLFLRSIHTSELCFYAIYLSVVEAISNCRVKNVKSAISAISHAQRFAELLHNLFKILRTMPVDHFAEFRDATGNASAVQSRNYQLMDAYYRGVDKEKHEVFARNHHLRFLKNLDHPEFISLRKIISNLPDNESALLFIEQVQALDKTLQSWRGIHVGFARKYLPAEAEGTGSTEGASYLKRFLHSKLFDDTKLDVDTITEEYPEFEGLLDDSRVPSSVTISPGA